MIEPGPTVAAPVSGPSSLSWDDSVRLASGYVENWTLAVDALILWKAVGAQARGHRAH
jgi:lipopolysaccharide/colanic/teichoic acid biosynthesis glycosyltransferase